MGAKITPNVSRQDRGGALSKPRLTAAGFLEVDCYTARVGVYEYTEPDGTVVGELLPPEEVFRPESLAGYMSAPVTREHPPGLVTPENARQHTRGAVARPGWQEGDKSAATIVIYDSELASEVQSGERDEVSPGYLVDLEETPGKWIAPDGRAIDYKRIQRNRRINHVAVVKYARGGPEIRVRIDGLPSLTQDASTTPPPPTGGARPPGDSGTMTGITTPAQPVQTGPVLKPFRLDSGMEIQVREDQVQILEAQQRQHKDALEAKDKLHKDALDKLTGDVAKLNKDAGELRAEVDKLKGEVTKEKTRADESDKKLKEATSPSAIAAVVKERAKLIAVAGPVLGRTAKVDGKDVKLDEMPDDQIRVAVLAKRIKGFQTKLDSVPEAQRSVYVAARFAEEAEKITAQLKRRQDAEGQDPGAEGEPGKETAEGEETPSGEEEPLPLDSEDEDPEDEQERSDSQEPRRVRADAVGAPGTRRERKDVKDEYVQRVNNAGALPNKRRIG